MNTSSFTQAAIHVDVVLINFDWKCRVGTERVEEMPKSESSRWQKQ